jgi:hypothetical protein
VATLKLICALGKFGIGVLERNAEGCAETSIFPNLTDRFPSWRGDVAAASHYGFHATLKAPFALATSVVSTRLGEDVASLATTLSQVSIGHLKVASIGPIIALVPVAASAQLEEFAACIVRTLDPLRAPLTAEDRARRRPETLSPRQIKYLDQWGYPYVFDEFSFHMTLTGPLPDAKRREAESALRGLYQPYDQHVDITDICIFFQPNRAAGFALIDRIRISG